MYIFRKLARFVIEKCGRRRVVRPIFEVSMMNHSQVGNWNNSVEYELNCPPRDRPPIEISMVPGVVELGPQVTRVDQYHRNTSNAEGDRKEDHKRQQRTDFQLQVIVKLSLQSR